MSKPARIHSIEQIRNVWLSNRGQDGSNWEDALMAVYNLGINARQSHEQDTLARIRAGGKKGQRKSLEVRRSRVTAFDAALLADVRAYRAAHTSHGRPAIAEALVNKYGKIDKDANYLDRMRAVAALIKRIERLEKRDE